jgi:hypothetical protein
VLFGPHEVVLELKNPSRMVLNKVKEFPWIDVFLLAEVIDLTKCERGHGYNSFGAKKLLSRC